jgi:transposase
VKTIALDVHKDWTQLTAASDQTREILLELKVRTSQEELRRVVSGIPGPKRVVFEEGPLSGLIRDALKGTAEEIISCDPTRNALIARSEDSNDENDSRRLITLSRAGAIHAVYVPEEPYRTLRSIVVYDDNLARNVTRVKNQIKALCRRCGVRYQGVGIYSRGGRKPIIESLSSWALKWQAESLYRRLDSLCGERVRAHRILVKFIRRIPRAKQLESIPGIKTKLSGVITSWIVDASRFGSRNAVSSYAGLGIAQGWTNWQPAGRAYASRRGQRALKRALFIAARAAVTGKNAFARRYEARLLSGWEDRKAIRDIARQILFAAYALLKRGGLYKDERIRIPKIGKGARQKRD